MELARATNRTVRPRNRSALLTKLFLDAPLPIARFLTDGGVRR